MPITVSGFKSYFDRVAREEDQAEVKRLRRRQDERAEAQESRQQSAFEAAQEDRRDTKARQKVERKQADTLYQQELKKNEQAIRAGEDQQDMNTRSIFEQDSAELWGMGEGHVFNGGDLRGYDRMAGIKNPVDWTATATEWDKGGIPKKLEYTNTKTGEKKSVNVDVQFIEGKKVERDAKKASGGRTGFTYGGMKVRPDGTLVGFTMDQSTGTLNEQNLGKVQPDENLMGRSELKKVADTFVEDGITELLISLPAEVSAQLSEVKTNDEKIGVLSVMKADAERADEQGNVDTASAEIYQDAINEIQRLIRARRDIMLSQTTESHLPTLLTSLQKPTDEGEQQKSGLSALE